MADIYDESGKDINAHNPQLLNKLLAALNECNEYGRWLPGLPGAHGAHG